MASPSTVLCYFAVPLRPTGQNGGTGGTLEKTREMANHADTRTTRLYDRRAEDVSLDDVERISI